MTCLQQHRAGLAASVRQLAVVRAVPVSCRTQQLFTYESLNIPRMLPLYTPLAHARHSYHIAKSIYGTYLKGRCQQASIKPRPMQPRPGGPASGRRTVAGVVWRRQQVQHRAAGRGRERVQVAARRRLQHRWLLARLPQRVNEGIRAAYQLSMKQIRMCMHASHRSPQITPKITSSCVRTRVVQHAARSQAQLPA